MNFLDNITPSVEKVWLSGYAISSEGYKADMKALLKRLPIIVSEISSFIRLQECSTPNRSYIFNVSFLNLTPFKIEIGAHGTIFITRKNKNRAIGNIDCKTQAIAYCLKDHPKLICIEVNQLKNSILTKQRLFVDTSQPNPQLEIDTENKIHYLSEKKVFILIFLSAIDKDSYFSMIPKDLITFIARQYDECLKNDFLDNKGQDA